MNVYKGSMETLLDSFVGSTSKTMQDLIKKKLDMVEKDIQSTEENIAALENKRNDKNKYIRELYDKISALKKEEDELPTKVLDRVEWLDKIEKIVVGGKDDLVAVYKLD